MRFKSGLRAVFKPLDSEFTESISGRNEIAAYRLSKLFGLDVVPTTVYRKIGRRAGSLQVFLPKLENGFGASSHIHPNSWFFDFLVNYSDSVHSRFIDKKDNYLVLSSRRQVLIDNAESFFAEFDENADLDTLKIWNASIIHPLRWLNLSLREIGLSAHTWARVKQVSDEEVRGAIQGLIPDTLIERILLRRRLYLARMSRYR